MSFDVKKQQLLVEYLISDPDTFALCSAIVKPEYFDPELRNSVKFITQYYENYNTTPSPIQIEAETDVKYRLKEVKKDEIQYCADEVEKFCRQQALWKAILDAPELMKENRGHDIELAVKNALLVGLHRDMGIRYYDTVQERLNRLLIEPPVESTGWSEFDRLLFGGIGRKELLLIAANSGGGKSITLNNLALNFTESGRNVLYITLELSQDMVSQRFDAMYSGYNRSNWMHHTDEIVHRVSQAGKDCGILDLVYMSPGTKPSQMKAFIKEYYLRYGIMPDLLIADYLGKMEPNHRILDNVNERDKAISSQFRELGVEFDFATASATQLNRTAVKTEVHDHSMVAGGYSQIQECDVFVTVNMTEIDKAKGEIEYQFLKTRSSDGVGSIIKLKWDGKFLRISDLPSQKMSINSQARTIPTTDVAKPAVSEGKSKLLSLLSEE